MSLKLRKSDINLAEYKFIFIFPNLIIVICVFFLRLSIFFFLAQKNYYCYDPCFPLPSFLWNQIFLCPTNIHLTLVMIRGGTMCPPPKCFYFFTKNLSPWPNPETHLYSPNFGFTLPWIFFSSENLVYKKFYYINSSNFLT